MEHTQDCICIERITQVHTLYDVGRYIRFSLFRATERNYPSRTSDSPLQFVCVYIVATLFFSEEKHLIKAFREGHYGSHEILHEVPFTEIRRNDS